jgi:ketosteroid isomerase-like protein
MARDQRSGLTDGRTRPGTPAPAAKPAPPGTPSRKQLLQRRITAVVILIGVAIAIMALTDAAPFFDDTTEEERVADSVESFFDAFADRDYAGVCNLFSPEVATAIEQAGATETKREEPRGCAEILEARFAAADAEELKLAVKIESVRVSGQRAVAEVIIKSEERPKGSPESIELERGPEGWLITTPVVTS